MPGPKMTGHVLADTRSGIALDLPRNWEGRYQLSDSLSAALPGVERELTLRFIRADSTIETQPMLVIRVVAASAWNALEPDSASALYGTMVARDPARTVAVRPALSNPFRTGTADALAYDSLMMIVIQRPMRASLRPESKR